MSESTKFRAYGNRILVDVTQSVPGMTKSGIALPENVEVSRIASGVVVSVGPGVMTAHGWDYPQIKAGDEIVFERARAQMIPDAGKWIVSLWVGEVIGVKRDEDYPRHSTTNGRIAEMAGVN